MIAVLLILILAGLALYNLPVLLAVLFVLIKQVLNIFKSYFIYWRITVPTSLIILLFFMLILKESPVNQWKDITLKFLLPLQFLIAVAAFCFRYRKNIK